MPNGTRLSERAYLTEHNASAGAEYVDGRIHYLPMPTPAHQRAARFLFRRLDAHLAAEGFDSQLHFMGLRVRVPDGAGGSRFREPDLALLLDADDLRQEATHWTGADFVAEIVSDDDPPRDTVRKRVEYAAAAIPEYWIVEPRPNVRTVTVLTLDGTEYREHGLFRDGDTAAGPLLPGFAVDVTACLDAR